MSSNYSLIHHFLEQSAERFPDKIALIHGSVRATYEEINTSANHLCQWLLGRGIATGDRIVLLLENSLEYVVSYYGILKAGAVAVPLSTDLKPDGLMPLFAELEPFAIISSKKFESLFSSLAAQLPSRPAASLSSFPAFQPPSFRASEPRAVQNSILIIRNSSSILRDQGLDVTEFHDVLAFGTGSNAGLDFDESSLASIISTSGSTGRPKGVMLSHRNVVSNTIAICSYLQLTKDDIQMVVLPFSYVMGKSLLNTHMAAGGTVVLNNKFAYPAAVLKEMVEERVTGFSGVPSTYAFLLHRSPLAAYRDKLRSLRYCSQAGGHMSRRIKKELRKILPAHTQIYVMYGATEASARLTYLAPEHFEDKMDSIGKPIEGVALRVVNPEGKTAGVGELGELVASGPNIMRGYWKDPEGTAEVMDGKGYYTGDLGYRDSEGFFFIKGRKDNLLKVGGHRINPAEIEDVILASGLTMEAAVVGIPDALLGQKLMALVVPIERSCSTQDILSHCAGNLPKYKVPSGLLLRRSLPKKSNGKIDRDACRNMVIK